MNIAYMVFVVVLVSLQAKSRQKTTYTANYAVMDMKRF